MTRARLQQDTNRRLEKLPEHRRRFAEAAIQRIMLRLYNEPGERVRPIISVVLDAVERDEYRVSWKRFTRRAAAMSLPLPTRSRTLVYWNSA